MTEKSRCSGLPLSDKVRHHFSPVFNYETHRCAVASLRHTCTDTTAKGQGRLQGSFSRGVILSHREHAQPSPTLCCLILKVPPFNMRRAGHKACSTALTCTRDTTIISQINSLHLGSASMSNSLSTYFYPFSQLFASYFYIIVIEQISLCLLNLLNETVLPENYYFARSTSNSTTSCKLLNQIPTGCPKRAKLEVRRKCAFIDKWMRCKQTHTLLHLSFAFGDPLQF